MFLFINKYFIYFRNKTKHSLVLYESIKKHIIKTLKKAKKIKLINTMKYLT